ncbi:TonB family protein [Candidatus Magnetomonas plexicatena]|uniref:TonB family protein n=1 Tax=Candidatus Magnetomonas plexicatena TaxID=2552947 RepID=UPI001C75E8B7|nr:TonB family protein [Nitrospirales bacterium LBB_01]
MFKRYIILSAIFHLILLLIFILIYKKVKQPWQPPKETITAKVVTKEPDIPDIAHKPAREGKKESEGQQLKSSPDASKSAPHKAAEPKKGQVPPHPVKPRTQAQTRPVEKAEKSPGVTTPQKSSSAKTQTAHSETPTESRPVKLLKEQPPSVSNLFDKDIIAKHARSGSQGTGRIDGAERDTAVSLETEDIRYEGYMRKLKQMIEAAWVYPPDAVKRGITGDLQVSFTINKNGTLAQVYVMRTSGNRSLDEAAMQSVRDASPFWPLPDDWQKDSFTVKGRFVYHIYDMNRGR